VIISKYGLKTRRSFGIFPIVQDVINTYCSINNEYNGRKNQVHWLGLFGLDLAWLDVPCSFLFHTNQTNQANPNQFIHSIIKYNLEEAKETKTITKCIKMEEISCVINKEIFKNHGQ